MVRRTARSGRKCSCGFLGTPRRIVSGGADLREKMRPVGPAASSSLPPSVAPLRCGQRSRECFAAGGQPHETRHGSPRRTP